MKRAALSVLALLCLSIPPAFALQTDATGCKDHPLFTRMPTYWIRACAQKEFDAHAFAVGPGRTETIEGRLWQLSYYPQATATTKPSELQIRRNYENAVKQIGGTLVATDKGHETFKIVKDGKETWVDLTAEFTGKYSLVIVERGAMSQDVVANAAALTEGLRASGHVAVSGIYFDTGKTELKPESKQAIGEIAKVLQADPALKLHVVGHTDNVGTLDSNLKLSQGRADAVVQALVSQHGIAAARLRGSGVGPLAPVSSNDAEDGRAQNRRVELVKQ